MVAERSRQEIWKAHIAKASHHPNGISGYCRETGITASGFYQWRKKLGKKKSQPSASSFLPVIAAEQVPIPRNFIKQGPDIDAQWLGQMLASFVRGLS